MHHLAACQRLCRQKIEFLGLVCAWIRALNHTCSFCTFSVQVSPWFHLLACPYTDACIRCGQLSAFRQHFGIDLARYCKSIARYCKGIARYCKGIARYRKGIARVLQGYCKSIARVPSACAIVCARVPKSCVRPPVLVCVRQFVGCTSL